MLIPPVCHARLEQLKALHCESEREASKAIMELIAEIERREVCRTLVERWPAVAVDEMEKALILAAYEHFNGRRGPLAKSLGISPRTLGVKLRQYAGLPDPAPQRRGPSRPRKGPENNATT